MKGRQDQPDMTEMTITFFQHVSTGLALCCLIGNTHARIKRTIRDNRSVMIEVEELAVRDLDHSLTDNIIVGPVRRIPRLATISTRQDYRLDRKLRIKVGHVQNTEFQLLDHLRNAINDLGFAQVDLRALWRLHHAVVKGRTWQGDSELT